LSVSSAFVVEVSVGSTEAVTVRVDDNMLEHVDVGVSDGRLHIGLARRVSVHSATLRATVVAKSLSEVELTGASQVHLADLLTGPALDVGLSGASMMEGEIGVDQLDLALSGSSRANLAGTTDQMRVQASGASHVDAFELQARSLDIQLSGASQGNVTVTETISAEASGASQLHSRGSPEFTKKEASGASIIVSAD
jgi:Putative auto-transporter adhesin, head GIN domain